MSEVTPPPIRRAVVITCSTRAANGDYQDRTGPIIHDQLQGWGFTVADPVVVPDGPPIRDALAAALAREPDLVLTTGGTGLSPSDVTPELTGEVIDRPVPGLAEAIRLAGLGAGVPTAMLSRGVAGVAGRTLIVNLPGSAAGVRDGLAVIGQVLDHAIDQLVGGSH